MYLYIYIYVYVYIVLIPRHCAVCFVVLNNRQRIKCDSFPRKAKKRSKAKGEESPATAEDSAKVPERSLCFVVCVVEKESYNLVESITIVCVCVLKCKIQYIYIFINIYLIQFLFSFLLIIVYFSTRRSVTTTSAWTYVMTSLDLRPT